MPCVRDDSPKRTTLLTIATWELKAGKPFIAKIQNAQRHPKRRSPDRKVVTQSRQTLLIAKCENAQRLLDGLGVSSRIWSLQ